MVHYERMEVTMKSHPQVMMELIRQYAKERGKSIQAEQFIQHLANRSISYRNYPTPQDMYDTFDNEFGKCACGGCYGQCEESIPELTVPPPAAYVHGFVLQSMQTVLTDMRTGSHQDRGD